MNTNDHQDGDRVRRPARADAGGTPGEPVTDDLPCDMGLEGREEEADISRAVAVLNQILDEAPRQNASHIHPHWLRPGRPTAQRRAG